MRARSSNPGLSPVSMARSSSEPSGPPAAPPFDPPLTPCPFSASVGGDHLTAVIGPARRAGRVRKLRVPALRAADQGRRGRLPLGPAGPRVAAGHPPLGNSHVNSPLVLNSVVRFARGGCPPAVPVHVRLTWPGTTACPGTFTCPRIFACPRPPASRDHRLPRDHRAVRPPAAGWPTADRWPGRARGRARPGRAAHRTPRTAPGSPPGRAAPGAARARARRAGPARNRAGPLGESTLRRRRGPSPAE